MATLDELRARAQAPTVSTPTPNTLEDFQARSQALQSLDPAVSPPTVAEEPPGIGERMVGRLLGTDVEDPLALERAGSTAAGAISGAMIGSRTPVAPHPIAGLFINPVTGALAGGAIGAFSGSRAPEGTLEGLEAIGAIPEGTRDEVGLNENQLQALSEAEALLDLATGGAFTAIGAGGRAARQVMSGGIRGQAGAREATAQAARAGVELPAAAAGNSRFQKFYTAVFGRFPFIGTPIAKAGKKAEKQLRKAVTDFSDRVGPVLAETDLGREIAKNANTVVKATNRHFNRRYDAVFKAADEAKVKVLPRNTLTKAEELLARVKTETPTTAVEAISGQREQFTDAGIALNRVQRFIRRHVLPLTATIKEEGSEFATTVTPKQTLKQMDGLLTKIDQELAGMEPAQAKFATALMSQLKTAIQSDVLTNLSGEGAQNIAQQLRALDQDFSQTMRFYFETATAKRFGSVKRRGLRGVAADAATRTPVDQLARIVVDMDSPQAVEELSRLVSGRTMSAITARALDDAFTKGLSTSADGTVSFTPERVMKALGLDRKASGRTKAFEALLAKSGGATLDDVRDVLATAKNLRNLEIPNVSTFIARRGTIGGLRGVVRGLMPGFFLSTSGAAGLGASGVIGGLFSMALFVGGTRGVSKMLADPLAFKSLREAAAPETHRIQRRTNMIRATRAVINGLVSDGVFPAEMGREMFEGLRDGIIDLAGGGFFTDKMINNDKPNSK